MKRRTILWLAVGVVMLGTGALLFKPVLFFVFEKTYPIFFKSDLITQLNTRYGMELRPNLHNARLVVPARPSPVHRVQDQTKKSEVKRRIAFLVNTDSHGFRGPEVPVARAPGSFRMVCLGDSITFGWGVPEEESYSGHLRTLLKMAMPDRVAEVVNGGIPGFPIQNIPNIIRFKVAPFKPDVIYAMKFGDLQSPNPFEAYRNTLAEIKQAADEIGARLILGTPPVSSFDLKPESQQFGKVLEEVGRQLEVPTIDFAPMFKELGQGKGLKLVQTADEQQLVRYEGGRAEVLVRAPNPKVRTEVAPAIYDYLDSSRESEALFFDDGHPDSEGNLLIARTIEEVLRQQGWLAAR